VTKDWLPSLPLMLHEGRDAINPFPRVIKRATIKQAANVGLSRLVPGGLNVVALLALAAWLSPKSYGVASTYIATATATANLLFGGIIQSALVHHSEHRARGKERRYESLHVANTLVLSAVIGAGSLALVWAGALDWRIAAATVATGAYTAIQEISHANLQFYRFAVGSCAQSLAFLGLAFVMVEPSPTIANTLEAFAYSYAIGTVISMMLVKPHLTRPSPRLLKTAFSLGTMPALSNLGLSLFALGCRYLLMFFGRADALGIFSFSLDVAQRGVGIFLNLTAFALVPHALKNSNVNDVGALWNALAKGWLGAAAVSLLGAAAIMALAATHLLGPLNRPVYEPISFGLICLAVIISRSSKMVLSPIAMRLRRTQVLLTPLFVIAPIALALAGAGIYLRFPYAVELIYTFTFAVWAACNYYALAPRQRNPASAPTSV
jgi:O-antigen/teichoic acid export membrane protein